MSRLAAWSARLAWFSLAVAGLSVIIVRTGYLEMGPTLGTFAAALIFAGLAILLALASFVTIWRQGLSGFGRAVGGLFLGLMLLAYPGYLSYRGSRLPAITDISTDSTNPPRFGQLARLRPRGRNAYPGASVAALQHAGYPDIQALQYEAPVALAYKVALAVVTKRKWHILDTAAPARGRPGEIEAVARTLIMGFRDDVVVRVSAAGAGARIDVRSASRYGNHDFGTNARRVVALLSDIDDAMTDALTVPPQPKPKEKEPPKKKPAPKRSNRR